MTFFIRSFPPPPPGEPACAGKPAELWTDYDKNDLRKVRRHNHPWVWEALRICGTCATETREWCLNDAVEPTRTHFSGISGGHVWINGQRVYGKPGIPDVHLCARKLHLLDGRTKKCSRCERTER
jgi:hypothetical protein